MKLAKVATVMICLTSILIVTSELQMNFELSQKANNLTCNDNMCLVLKTLSYQLPLNKISVNICHLVREI